MIERTKTMYISRVEIYNFRSLKEVEVNLNNTNILIGPNNAGKTSFFEAINYAIGWNFGRIPSEDDFFIENSKTFDPKKANPIKVIIDFREGFEEQERFIETIEEDFEGVIQFDESIVSGEAEPIKYIRLQYTCEYSPEKSKFVESRSFLDQNYDKISGRDTSVNRKRHLSYFPFLYLETLRNIKSEIKNPSSFWGKIKKSIDYSSKEEQISELMNELEQTIIKDQSKLEEVTKRLKEIEHSIKISDEADNITLKVFSSRSWEMLDNLTFYLKTAESNISLPIEKHGMGTQNIAIFSIFNAYLDILLPQVIENQDTTPIIGIEEPEAHVYPHSQRAIFEQISKMKGQKIISTHSPYIVDQANINDFILFRSNDGETEVKQVPKYKTELKFGLPKKAYENNLFLKNDELHSLKRYIQFKNTELLFSSLFLMCEGDSEKIFFEMVSQSYLGVSLGRLGVSVISCDGKKYSDFLKLASSDALDLSRLIFSDGEEDTVKEVENAVKNNGFTQEDIKNNVLFLPKDMDFEEYCIYSFGKEVFLEIISEKYNDTKFEEYKRNILRQNTGESPSDDEILNKFIDGQGKTLFAEYLAEYLLYNKIELPPEINELFTRINE